MRLFALLCSLGVWAGLWTTGALATAPAPQADIEKSFQVALDPGERSISGTLVLRLPKDSEAEPLTFTLASGLNLERAEQAEEPLEWEETGSGRYRLEAPAPQSPITLSWSGQLPAQLPGGGYWSEDNLWLPGQLAWYPRLDTSAPFAADIEVSTPDSIETVVSGHWLGTASQDNQRQSRFAHPQARQLSLAAGRWQAATRDIAGGGTESVTLRTLFPERLSAGFADTYLDAAERALLLFQQRLGPYPYSSFTMAASSRPIGFAFAGFTLLGEQVIALPFIPHTSLPHELMHGWWGTAIQATPGQGNWSEALTTYLADYAMAAQKGEEGALRQRWLTDLNALPDADHLALQDFGYQRQPQDRLIGYQHGAMLFHMLEAQIGTSAFDSALRQLIDQHRFGQANWQAIQDAFEDTSGQALGGFFDAWVAQPGRPTLGMDTPRLEETPEGYRVTFNLSQTARPHDRHDDEERRWPLRLPVDIHYAQGETDRTWLSLETASERFTLDTRERPTRMVIDPDYQVLRQLPNAPETLRELSLATETRWLRLGAFQELPLPRGATELDSLPDDLTTTPLWVIGTPDEIAKWWDDQGLEAQAQPPAEQPQDAPDGTLWRQPGTQLGIISAPTPQAAMRLVRGLRHWGSASYVVLNDNDTQRGTWESEPALQHTF
ncbi:MAG: M1 family metallopeptidase [Halomonas sp.]|nr:M1 family aminopeptidase [Halomonas sp.]TVM05995.1 MAG: M1 family metallopeptidase [Halomonas sp.]